MITLGVANRHFLFDKTLAPAAVIEPGTPVRFETQDACCGEVRTVEQFAWRRTTDRPSNPMVGPVFVAGAEPGDTLVVEIAGVELAPDGFQLIGPQRAIIRDEVPDWTCYAFTCADGRIRFPNSIELPAAPVIGQFGNAPAGHPTNHPNRLGGNIDCPAITVGATLYLPVEVPGALFSLGDVHACQGDGEVVGAPEVGATVTININLRKGRHADWFMVEDAQAWHSCIAAATEAEAARLAVLQNAGFIAERHGVALKDALVLLTLLGKISIARTGKWGDHPPVVCASFMKQQVADALANHTG